jgi:D-aminopeptidase
MVSLRKRVRELGITPGILPVGQWNAVTDVAGVRVGHVTLIEGDDQESWLGMGLEN